MFLVERAIGIGIYMVLLLFTCLLLVNTNMRSKPILKFYLLCLCVMAFCYKPYVTADLHRIYLIVEAFKDMELSQFIMAHVMSSSIPVSQSFQSLGIIYWLQE